MGLVWETQRLAIKSSTYQYFRDNLLKVKEFGVFLEL
jgi:hypothetical protein